jgi:2-hydroxy-4-carboxymuconate semialdehyde hemiacetal dehydrogenase
VDGYDKPIDVSQVDVSLNGIELEDREFFAAIKEGRQPKSSVADVLPAMQTLGRLEQQLNAAMD